MNPYEKRNRLALRAGEVLGSEEAETLMDALSVGDRLEMNLARFRAEMDQKFAGIDQRFAQIDQRFAGIDQRFAAIDQRFAEIDQKFVKVDERFVALEKSMLESEKRMHSSIAKEAASTRRYVLTTSLSAVSLVLAVMIPMFVAVLLGN